MEDLVATPAAEATVAADPMMAPLAISGLPVPDQPAPSFAQQVTVWRDEILAWFKTLFSAAIYATLIVPPFQVARVEGRVWPRPWRIRTVSS
jgi:hypothetical protein